MNESDVNLIPILEALVDKINAISAGGGGLTADQLELIITKTAGNTADAMRTALIPENKVNPGISAYSYPEGELKRPKPVLKRESIFCGGRLKESEMTPEEIDACNAIDGPCEARGGAWRAFIKKDGTREGLIIHCDEAVERDKALGLPSFLAICYELKQGPQAVDLVALTRQLNDMKAQLAAVA